VAVLRIVLLCDKARGGLTRPMADNLPWLSARSQARSGVAVGNGVILKGLNGARRRPGPPKRSRPCSRKASQWHPPARKLSRNCRLVGRHEEGHVRRGRTCRGPAGRTRNPRGLAKRRPSIARSRIKKIHAVVGRDGAAPRLARSCQIISKEDAEQFMGIKNPRVSGLQDATPIPARRARYNSPDASASNISPGMAMLAILCDGKV
jgi:hypothetical protein